MTRPSGTNVLERLGDTRVRIFRAIVTKGRMGDEQRTYELVEDTSAIVNRNVAPTGDAGPGLAPIGRRRLYCAPATDVRPQDAIQILEGPDALQLLLVDEPPTRPRDHHVQIDCILWRGALPDLPES